MGLPAKSPQAILWGPRVGGGTILPCQRTTVYFTSEYDVTRKKGVIKTPA